MRRGQVAMRPNHSSGRMGTHSTTSETYDARHRLDTFFVSAEESCRDPPHPPPPSFLFRFAAAMHACLGIIHPDPLQLIHPAVSLYLFLRLTYLSFPSLPSGSRPVFLRCWRAETLSERTLEGPARGRVNRVWRRPGSLVCVGPMRKDTVLVEETRNIEANKLMRRHNAMLECHACIASPRDTLRPCLLSVE